MRKRIFNKTGTGRSCFFYSILAQSRAGKFVSVGSIVTQAYSQEIPVVIRGYPKLDVMSTFSDCAEFMKEQGTYFDISKQHHNLLEAPGFPALPHNAL
jgi:hypothetical protein